ncbi:MAG: HNH endonuclease signature motif containing protein [Candidatus Limiplasma sp.]|nr:HNH endonuclease signature motif containing protein [Candidatus Limiplasma sp.]
MRLRRYEKQVDPFYRTRAWEQVREAAMQRDHGMCVECMAEYERCDGVRPRPATLVHHVIPRSERPDLALALDNLESLCADHHAKKHPEKGERPTKGNANDKMPQGMTVIKI